MHLLHIKVASLEEFTGDPDQLEFKTFVGDDTPPYAILSHTWGNADDEVSWAELQDAIRTGPESEQSSVVTGKAGYNKIRWTCRQAITDGHSYAWIDTCCIDKDSSSELSRAINSMFYWYQHSSECYAYLADVDPDGDQIQSSGLQDFSLATKSRWFTRGWTLQELIAPRTVRFFGGQWQFLGTRKEHCLAISEQTGIDEGVLLVPSEENILKQSVAARMSWASARKTTQQEDEAYCLLGLFGVNMPLLYGERDGAFQRLQREIFRQNKDTSIFVWSSGLNPHLPRMPLPPSVQHRNSLLAPSVSCFTRWGDIQQSTTMKYGHVCDLNDDGLKIETMTGEESTASEFARTQYFLAYLHCQWKGLWVCLRLTKQEKDACYRDGVVLHERVTIKKLKRKTIMIHNEYSKSNQIHRPPGRLCFHLMHRVFWLNLTVEKYLPEEKWETSTWMPEETFYGGLPPLMAFSGAIRLQDCYEATVPTILLRYGNQFMVLCFKMSRKHAWFNGLCVSAASFDHQCDRESMLKSAQEKDSKKVFKRNYKFNDRDWKVIRNRSRIVKERLKDFSDRIRDKSIPIFTDVRLYVRIERGKTRPGYSSTENCSIILETYEVPRWRQFLHRSYHPIHLPATEAGQSDAT